MEKKDKEPVLSNKAKDLLKYSTAVTKPVGDKSIEIKDALSLMLKLSRMKADDAQQFCVSLTEKLKSSAGRQGFPKSTAHSYIRTIRQSALDIAINIQMANDCYFEAEYRRRLALLDEVLKNCNLLLLLIEISLELKYINIKRCKYWTKLVTDVKYMTLAWKKKDTARAECLKQKTEEKEHSRLAQTVVSALKNNLI